MVKSAKAKTGAFEGIDYFPAEVDGGVAVVVFVVALVLFTEK